MIKKILFPIIVILIGFLIYLNYLAYKAPSETKIITQSKTYSITNEDNLSVLFYANKKTAYQEVAAIEAIYLKDINDNKKLTLELIEVKKLGKWNYLNDTYSTYNYTFKLPSLDKHFFIEEAYLLIRLKNSQETNFYLGSFDYYISNDSLEFVELYGRRSDKLPALETISFKFNLDYDIYLESINISTLYKTNVGKTIKDNELITIKLNTQDKISDALAILLTYQENGHTYQAVLPLYLYYQTNENHLEYGVLNNVYLFD